jgi:hypothetical protein
MKYFVCWRTWNRDLPQWRPILKFQRCKTLEKAERMKKNLEIIERLGFDPILSFRGHQRKIKTKNYE